MRGRGMAWLLPGLITVLALATGALHLLLNFVLFRGQLWGSPSFAAPPGDGPRGTAPAGATPGRAGPPAGAAPDSAGAPARVTSSLLGLPLNELFTLNLLGYLALLVLFWLAPRWLGRRRWLVDVALILYTAATIAGWLYLGRPNPRGLGYPATGLEVALLAALVAHLWALLGRRGAGEGAAA
jgi:hypothetical protein